LHHHGEFASFIGEVVKRKLGNGNDKEFASKCGVRDLRRNHREELQVVDKAYFKALKSFERCPSSSTLNDLDRSIRGAEQAVQSMTKFIESEVVPEAANAAKIEKCRALLPNKKTQLAADVVRRDAVRTDSHTYQTLILHEAEREEVYERIGLRARLELARQESKGSGTGRKARGKDFETEAFSALETYYVPKIAAELGIDAKELICVRNMKFGLASSKGSTAEIDSLICRRVSKKDALSWSVFNSSSSGSSSTKPAWTAVEVLAVCEVKRNADDCGDAFASYQPSMRWLCGLREEYDPALYVTKAFPNGHFEAPHLHQYYAPQRSADGDDGDGGGTSPLAAGTRRGLEVLVFTVESFQRLREARARVEMTRAEARQAGVLPLSAATAPIPTPTVKNEAAAGHRVEEDDEEKEVVNISLFLSSVHFICRFGRLDCISSKAMAWALDRVASDERLGPGARLVRRDKEEEEEEEEEAREGALVDIRAATAVRYPPRLSTVQLLELQEAHGLLEQFIVIE
jgi:hypothetical protein